MFKFNNKKASIILLILIGMNELNVTICARCPRIPSGQTQDHAQSYGNYVIKFSDPSDLYRPGQLYTGK